MLFDSTPQMPADAARSAPDQISSERWILFALPGLGKSTFAKACDRVRDCDFGVWRQAQGIDRLWDKPETPEIRRLYRRFVRDVILPAIDEGAIVLCNEPAIWKCIPSDINIVVVLPSADFTPTWWSNLVARCHRLSPQPAYDPFYQELLRDGLDWPQSDGWRIPDAPILTIDDYSDWPKVVEFLEE